MTIPLAVVLLNLKKKELQELIAGGKGELAIEPVADEMDNRLAFASRNQTADLISRHTRTLGLVNRAIRKLDEGEWGDCESCNEPIADPRLNVLPWAAYCLGCQEKVDNE